MAPVQAGANVAATGLPLRYLGSGDIQHAYAYSGKIEITGDSGGATETLLAFTSGNSYLDGVLNFSTTAESSVTVSFEVSMNGSVVSTMNVDTRGNGGFIWPTSYSIIIPPLTIVVVKWGIDTSTESGTVLLTGRVYGAE